jgi:hypothetical protein
MHISPVFIDGLQFDDCDVLEVGKLYVVYHRNVRKGTGGEYFYGMYNARNLSCGQLYSHEFINCRVYTNSMACVLKRTDVVKSVVQVIPDREFIFRKSS